MTELPVDELFELLENAWSADTSTDPDNWSTENPSYGQSAVSALVVQDYLGGELVRGTVRDVSHYWNRLPDETEVDMTIQQFEGNALLEVEDIEERDREYVLSFPATAERYEILKQRVAEQLQD